MHPDEERTVDSRELLGPDDAHGVVNRHQDISPGGDIFQQILLLHDPSHFFKYPTSPGTEPQLE